MQWPLVGNLLKNLLIERPIPIQDSCKRCYQCKEICAVRAINNAGKNGKTPKFDKNRCIRCYCCMEICPEGAITLKQGRLQWMLGRR